MAVTRTLGGVTLIKPNQWDESFSWVENVNQSEAGTDLVNIIRSNKYSCTAQFNVSRVWYHKFYELSQQPYLFLDTYDPLTDAHKNRKVRMRDFTASFQQYSDKIGEGLWVVSFSLTEF